MLKLPNMLLIGATGRNAGKTELACALIRKYVEQKIVALKVTAIDKSDGSCPRGGRGCGVCSSLDGRYCITEETEPPPGKDTARLLKSGAHKVFWLRVLRPHLLDGLEKLLEVVGPATAFVCESNSLRTVVEPGLFLMVKCRGSQPYKATAQAVREFADRTLTFDGQTFNPDAARIALSITPTGTTWLLREQATAILLAGGRSRRMQQDKALLPVGDRQLIKHICDLLAPHFDNILLSAAHTAKYSFLGIPTVADRVADIGPLMGIGSCLAASSHEYNFVIACDMPEPDMHLVHNMLDRAGDYDAVVPRGPTGLLEPLFAIYRKSLSVTALQLIDRGERRVRALFDLARVLYIDIPEHRAPRNLNTIDDYRGYLQR